MLHILIYIWQLLFRLSPLRMINLSKYFHLLPKTEYWASKYFCKLSGATRLVVLTCYHILIFHEIYCMHIQVNYKNRTVLHLWFQYYSFILLFVFCLECHHISLYFPLIYYDCFNSKLKYWDKLKQGYFTCRTKTIWFQLSFCLVCWGCWRISRSCCGKGEMFILYHRNCPSKNLIYLSLKM